jgi:Major Facilitator Superfamily
MRGPSIYASVMIAGVRQTMARRWESSAYRTVLTQPVLRPLLPAFAVSAVGDGMSVVAVAWLALRLATPGQRGLVVGAAVAAYTLPGAAGAVLLSRPLRGLTGGRLVAADATLRAVTLAAIPILFAFDSLTVAAYVALLAGSSLLHAWGIAGRYTLIAEHLPEATRRTGNALLSTFDMGSLIVGPLLAGLVVAIANPSLAIAADAASFAILAAAAWSSAGPATSTAETTPEAARREWGQGFRVIARRPALAGLLALTCVFFLLYGPVEVALPLYVVDKLGGAAGLLGLFWAVFGIGAVAGSLAAGVLRRLPLWPTLVASVIGWGAALVPMGLLHLAIPALTSFAVGGLLYAPYTALSATLFQRESPPTLLSQVLAARGALTVLAAPLGTAFGGPLVAYLGASNTLLASGAATILLGLIATVALSARKRAGPRRSVRA